MAVDIIGIENVAEFIKNTGLTKFSIDRPGSSRGTLPVFELLQSTSNNKAIEEFKRWARVVNGSNEYKLTLFDKLETVTDEQGEQKEIKSKSKSNKAEIYFKLIENEKPVNIGGTFDIEQIKMQALNEFRTEQKIKDLEEKIKRLEEEEEEEEEENLSGLGGLNIHNIVSALNAFSMLKNNNNNAPAINGVNENNKLSNINKALEILSKHDPEIDTDLLKLADLAQNNSGTFQMLLKTLRSM